MAGGSVEVTLWSSRTVVDCWAVLTDVGRIAGWVDIVRDVAVHHPLRSYTVTLEDRIGPFRLRADLDVIVTKVVEHQQISVMADGRDRQVGSHLSVSGTMGLSPDDEGTSIRFEGTYAVEGRVATVGAPMIRRKADSLVTQFVARVKEELG